MSGQRVWIRLLLLVMASVCTVSCAGRGEPESPDETQQLRRRLAELRQREKSLEAESSLARNNAPYLVVNLQQRTVELKARERTLRSFKVRESGEFTPGRPAGAAWTMLEKKPLEAAERPKIAPGAGEEATADAATRALWGPHRMPADYDLICDGGRILQIRALPEAQTGRGLIRWAKSLYRRAADRYRRWWTPRSSLPQHAIQLYVSEKDSRLLFWSLPKQINILIVRP